MRWNGRESRDKNAPKVTSGVAFKLDEPSVNYVLIITLYFWHSHDRRE